MTIQRHWKKRVCSLLIAFAMTSTLFFPFWGVHAAENQLPTKEQFATIDELKSFDTNDSDGTKNPAKVYFGMNPDNKTMQQWWIAGSQDAKEATEKTITLFAVSPLAKKQRFNKGFDYDKQYDSNWSCTYQDGVQIDSVYPNHYGASPLRDMLNGENGLLSKYFTDAEQSLMNETIVYTNDEKHQDIIAPEADVLALARESVYSTKDKLYLPYIDNMFDDHYITVGTNSVPDDIKETLELNNGLNVDMDYWGNDDFNERFWLRTPSASQRSMTSTAQVGVGVRDEPVGYDFEWISKLEGAALMPAFELNLLLQDSQVIFASAAPAASSDGQLEIKTVNDKNKEGAFTLRYASAKDIGTATISQTKESVGITGVTNENTYLVVQNKDGAWSKKVTNDNVIHVGEMSDNLTSFENCKVWLETTDATNRMTYAKEATQSNLANVKIVSGQSLDVKNGIQPNVSNAVTDITVKAADGYYLPKDYINNIQSMSWNGLQVGKTTSGFTISGTPTRDVYIRLPDANAYPKADTPKVTLQKTSTSITATVTNHKEEFGNIEYKWNDGNWEQGKNKLTDLTPDTLYNLAIRFTGKDDYRASDEYSSEIRTLKAGNTVIVVPADLTITYREGLKLSDVALPANSGWSWVNGDTSLQAGTKSYPAEFDTTNLESTTDFKGVDGYNANTHKVTRNVEVKVDKSDSQVNITTSSLDKVYDENAVNDPEYTTSGSNGKVTIIWQENTGTEDDPKWEDLQAAPIKAGIYKVTVELAGNDNYNAASDSLDFVISKRDNSWTEELSIKDWTYGDEANAPNAKAQFGDVTFAYSSEENGTYTSDVPVNAGTWYVKATVAGTETYIGLESIASFEIAKAVLIPEKITGLVLEQGQPLSKLELPEQFKWIDETFTANDLGTHIFKAIYTPEDTFNYETIEVEIEVKVVSKQTNHDESDINRQDIDKSDSDKPSSDEENAKTGDQTNVTLLALLFSMSAIGIVVSAVWRRKKPVKNK